MTLSNSKRTAALRPSELEKLQMGNHANHKVNWRQERSANLDADNEDKLLFNSASSANQELTFARK
jgi:hypothetical protein